MFNNVENFYPTPINLINKMLRDIDFRTIRTVLEPSAGKGSIAEEVLNKLKSNSNSYYNSNEKVFDIDCIEINEDLRHVLTGKGFRVIHDDFLTLNTYKNFDLIIMNPPFADGEKHLLKALEMQETGGQIVCLLNSETIKNSYSNSRKDLVQKLKDYNANIEFIQDAFITAERKTGVEIALIRINIVKTNKESVILKELRQEEQYRAEKKNHNDLISSDFIERIIQTYDFEVTAGLKLINEYENLQPLILKTFKKDKYSNHDSILKLSIDEYGSSNNSDDALINSYIKNVRYKYWEALFTSEEFSNMLTSNLRQEYMNKISELKDYDFSYYNIKQIQIDINKSMIKGVEDTILALFEEFSHKYNWYDETSKNTHYYNGWKTNKSYLINKKVIIPLNGFDNYNNTFYPTRWSILEKLQDIEKVFNYLDGGLTEDIDIKEQLEVAEKLGDTKNIKLKYFDVTFYKKGTCHIVFTNEDLLKKFNIFGSCGKGWLPPAYGKIKYNDMTKEEQTIINEFEGKESYQKTMDNTKYFIFNPSNILALPETA